MSYENIMVTGGAGMIGSNLVKRLILLGHNVFVVDNLWRGRVEYLFDEEGVELINLKENFYRIDLSVPGSLNNLLEKIEYVYHLADIVAGIDYVFRHQGNVFRQNMLINSNTISSVRENPHIKGFIYVGTVCSFPAHLQTSTDSRPLVETDQYPANPESAYGWSKLMGEYEALLMEEEVSIPTSILTLHNVYGPPCDFSDERSQVIPSLIRKAINWPNESFSVWGGGSQARAFVHVRDVVDALIAAKDKALGKGLIQIGPSHSHTIREIAERIVSISGKDIDIQYDRSKPEGDKGRSADYSKAKHVLDWQPNVTLEDGLQDLYCWISNQLDNIRTDAISSCV